MKLILLTVNKFFNKTERTLNLAFVTLLSFYNGNKSELDVVETPKSLMVNVILAL